MRPALAPSIPAVLAIAAAATLVGCGQAPASDEAGTAPPAPAAAARPAPTPEEKLAILATLPAPYAEGDLENGRRVFARCRSCHTLPEGAPNMTGPNLWQVFGRPAGSHPDYNYSNALKESGIVWDAAQLDAWLANPRTFLPGNKMSFAGIPDATDRRDVIAWLKVETGYTPPAA